MQWKGKKNKKWIERGGTWLIFKCPISPKSQAQILWYQHLYPKPKHTGSSLQNTPQTPDTEDHPWLVPAPSRALTTPGRLPETTSFPNPRSRRVGLRPAGWCWSHVGVGECVPRGGTVPGPYPWRRRFGVPRWREPPAGRGAGRTRRTAGQASWLQRDWHWGSRQSD